MNQNEIAQQLHKQVCGRIEATKVAIYESIKSSISYEEIQPIWRKLEKLNNERKIYEKIMGLSND